MSVPGGPDLSVPDASVPDASVPDASAAPPFCWRRERWLFGGVFLAAFALYAVTAARYVGLEDDAIFIGALHFWGISHPPGYPAHTLLGGIFYHLIPFGSPAFKAHLFSGFAAAAACVSLYIVVRMLSVGRAVAVFAALAFAASLDFWSQAVIAEVYTLNMFFFFTLIALCVGYARSGARRWIFAAAVVFGVGMANHYPLLCLGAAGLLILIAAPMRRRPLDIIGCAALAVVAAAPFYLWMVWRSHGDVVYNFYGPINDFAAFEFYFLRRGYAGVDNQLGSDWRDKLEFLTYFGGRMLRQFTPFGFLLVVIGFFAMALHRPLHRRRGLHRLRRLRRVWVALLVSFLASSVVLIFLVNFNAGVLTFAIFRPYFLPAYGVMAIWLAFGAEAVASVVLRVLRLRAGRWRAVVAASLAAGVAVASLAAHWQENNRRDKRWTHDFSLLRLAEIAPGGILFAYGDLDFPLGYMHYVEGVRPDILLYSDQGLLYNNRLYGPRLPETPPPDDSSAENKTDVLYNFFRQRYRPIYYRPERQDLFNKASPSFDVSGFLHRTNRGDSAQHFILKEGLRRWASANLEESRQFTDVWTRYHSRAAVSHLAIAAFNAEQPHDAVQGGGELSPAWREFVRRARERYPLIRITMADYLVRGGRMDEEKMRAELAWADSFDARQAEFYDEELLGRLHALRAALIAALDGDGDETPAYGEALRRALREFPSAQDNPALAEGLHYFLKTGDDCAFVETLAAFYPDGAPAKWRAQTPAAEVVAHCGGDGLGNFGNFGDFFRGGVK